MKVRSFQSSIFSVFNFWTKLQNFTKKVAVLKYLNPIIFQSEFNKVKEAFQRSICEHCFDLSLIFGPDRAVDVKLASKTASPAMEARQYGGEKQSCPARRFSITFWVTRLEHIHMNVRLYVKVWIIRRLKLEKTLYNLD